MTERGPTHLLLDDGTLSLTSTPDAAPLIAGWLPVGLRPSSAPATAEIVVTIGAVAMPSGVASTLRLLDVDAWVDGDAARFHHPSGAGGRVDLRARRAEIVLSPAAADAVEPMLTLSAALLIGRSGRALVHAAAVVSPSEGVWLLVGDSHAGKSSTVATLALGGWGYLSDDQVVIGERDGEVVAEGWCRPFNLDAGWDDGAVTGRRVASSVIPAGRVPGPRRLAGVLLPAVLPDGPTTLAPATSADAFEALVRQSPWLLADRAAAPSAVALLTRVAQLSVRGLSLGLDGYRRPERLVAALADVAR
ncbi:MAG: hypothetical protein ACREL4_01035 [Gemmatimonadales bacterium]